MRSVATPPVAHPAGLGITPGEKIALRAYEKWCQRGCTHGHDMQDWLEAETELRTETGRPAAKPVARR